MLQSVNVLQAQVLQKSTAADAFKHPGDKLLTILTVGDRDIGVVVVHKATFFKIRLCELSLTQPYEISQKLGTGDAGGFPYLWCCK